MLAVKDIHYYLSLPYTIEIIREDEETWFARVKELPGCITEGDSPQNAAEMILDAMEGWIEVALEDEQTIPEPRPAQDYSGKFVVRVPKRLHRDLVQEAEYQGVSLNHYINTELARSVGQPNVDKREVKVAETLESPAWSMYGQTGVDQQPLTALGVKFNQASVR